MHDQLRTTSVDLRSTKKCNECMLYRQSLNFFHRREAEKMLEKSEGNLTDIDANEKGLQLNKAK